MYKAKFLVLAFAFVQAIDGAVAYSQQAAPPAPSFTDMLGRMLPMFLVVFFIFYFMILKPQQQKQKSQQDLLGSLKRGDNVVTTGGIFGRVASVEKDYVLLEIANNVKIRLELSHITKKIEKAESEKSAA